jgi:L-malate glycosyltransferase
MHVLLITTAYKNKYNPVNSLFFYDQAKALINNGCQVGVICPIPITFATIWKRKKINFTDEFYDDNGISTSVSPYVSYPKLVNKSAKDRLKKGRFLFEKYIAENGMPNIIHVHTFLAGEIAIWIKEKYNIPYVVTEHSSNFERNLFSKIKLKLAERVFTNSSSNIAVSQQLAHSITNHIGNFNFTIIPNIVDVSFFKPKLDARKSCFQFINVGRLDDNKNQIQLIEAFYKSFRGQKQFRLLLVGDGPAKSKLQAKIVEFEMSDQITIYGHASRNEVLNLLQQSDCFVSSSKVETFGVVLIEAMSCGLPVLSTKSGGPESIVISKKLGVLCDSLSLQQELSNIVNTKFNSDYIRKYTIDNYSEEIISKHLKSIFLQITRKG